VGHPRESLAAKAKKQSRSGIDDRLGADLSLRSSRFSDKLLDQFYVMEPQLNAIVVMDSVIFVCNPGQPSDCPSLALRMT